jgi:hypothetical protein
LILQVLHRSLYTIIILTIAKLIQIIKLFQYGKIPLPKVNNRLIYLFEANTINPNEIKLSNLIINNPGKVLQRLLNH